MNDISEEQVKDAIDVICDSLQKANIKHVVGLMAMNAIIESLRMQGVYTEPQRLDG